MLGESSVPQQTTEQVLRTLVRKTLYDRQGVAWGLSPEERDERDRRLEEIDKIGSEPFNGVVAPITPVVRPNLFQLILAQKLRGLKRAGLGHFCFFRNAGYAGREEDARRRPIERTRHFLEVTGASPGKESWSSSTLSKQRNSEEHQQLKEMLARFEMKDAVRLSLEETHLAALYAIQEVRTPFLLIGYNEKVFVDVVSKFLPAGANAALIPIYMLRLHLKRELILLTDALPPSKKTGEGRTPFIEKLDRELRASAHPEEILTQLECLLLDRRKNLTAENVSAALKRFPTYRKDVEERLQKVLAGFAADMSVGEEKGEC